MPALRKLAPVPLTRVAIEGAFWAPRQATNREVTLPIEYQQSKDTGRIDAWRLDWKPGMPDPPHHFWDSDVAKWIEAVAYAVAVERDAHLEGLVDDVVELIAAAQREDGYLNIHFTVVEPQNRWANLRDMHELYCAGHLMEAAVAYYEATGKRKLLDVLCRYADHINSKFGPGEGQLRGYPGHEEIELALVKLYRATGEARYLRLASFFVDERGRQPHYFDLEARARSEVPDAYRWRPYDYCQAHLPVREQSTAEGHAVRAMYLYSGMADVAAETGDESLLAACRRLWRNVTERRMYATGGVGSSAHGERFTYDYDLPNDLAYAETCAAIGLVFWAHRMLQFEGDAAYADVMERALYNGVLSGVSLDGRQFFYGNPLEVDPTRHAQRPDLFRAPAVSAVRQEWFGCACCPPNIARLLASLGQYVYSQSESAAFVHLYVGGSAELSIGGKPIRLSQETRYPWEGRVSVAVQPERELALALCLRIPEWARGDLSRVSLTVNGEAVDVGGVLERGYARISRAWRPGETVVLDLPMSVQRVRAHPAVRANAGRVALQRGPLVYCLEEADNGPNLQAIALPRDAELRAAWEGDPLGGVVTITGEALRSDEAAWNGELYTPNDPKAKRVSIKAVPYYAWANRTPGEMLVWLRETG